MPNNRSINPGYASVGNATEGIDVSYLQAPIDTPAYRGAYPVLRYKDGKLFETGGGISLLKNYFDAEKLLQTIPEDRRSDSFVLDWYKDLPPQYSLESMGSSGWYNPMEFNKDFSGPFSDRTAARWISDMSDIDNQLRLYGSRSWWDKPLSRPEGLDISFVRDDIVQINDYMTGASDSIVISAKGHNEFTRTFVLGPDYDGEYANNDGFITLSGDEAASFAAMYQGVLSVSSKYELVTGYLPTQDSFFPESYETTMLKMQSALTGATAPMAAIAGLAARVMGYDERSVAGVTSAVASIENILQAGPLGMKINPRRMSTVNNYPSVTSSRNTGPNFADGYKLVKHFEKHGAEFKGVRSAEEYLGIARDVMRDGTKIKYQYKDQERIGYVKFMGTTRKGKAKFAFVGTNSDGYITTLHSKSGKDFWKTINRNPQDKVIRPAK